MNRINEVWKRHSKVVKCFLMMFGLGLLFFFGYATAQETSLSGTENSQLLKKTIKNKPELKGLFNRFGDPNKLLARFAKGKEKAAEEWQSMQSQIQKMKNIGTTRTLEILPLIDWKTSNDDLKGEAGVSYLIKTDKNTILFDVGYNPDQSDPSPLLWNMKQLGVSINDFDTIVISHNHLDHVGGMKWSKRQSFSLTHHQIGLGQKRVYTPIPMTYKGLAPIHAEQPTMISAGVSTIGTISTPLFFLGWTEEQALAINVEGKGIVLIVGCGHQTVPKLLARVEALFDAQLYGIIGGLHFPVTDSRMTRGNLKLQTYIGTGKIPGQQITIEDVQANIKLLKKHNPGIVALSPHDSCDASIAEFRNAFPDIYKEIRVGNKIIIGR